MGKYIIISSIMVIIQMILTNRVIKRWEEYNDAEDINDYNGYCHKWLHRDTSGFFHSYEYKRTSMLKPDHLFISSQSLAIISWFTYLSCYILYIIMLGSFYCKEVHPDAFNSIPWLFLSYCISFAIAYGYGKLLGYVLTLIWYIIKYTCKTLWFLFRVLVMTPVFFIDDLLSGKLMDDILSKRKPKSIKYLGESLEIFHFIVK